MNHTIGAADAKHFSLESFEDGDEAAVDFVCPLDKGIVIDSRGSSS